MKNNVTYRINEIGQVVGGGTPRTENKEFWDGNIPWLSPKDLTDYSSVYISAGENNITELGLKKSSAVMLPKGTVLLSSRAPVGYLAIAENDLCTNQGFKSIVCNDKIDNLFLYYYLKQNIDYIKCYASGATFPELSGNTLKKIKITFFENLDYQKKIANILYKYDQLIEINNKRIKLLEQMIENIYKEWFVRFRFPKHENTKLADSKIGKIPNNFNVVKMQDVFEYYIGGGWGNDEEDKDFSQPAYVIRGADFPYVAKGDVSTCPYRFHTLSNFTARKLQEDDIILEVSGGTAEQPVGRTVLVDKDIIDRLGGNVICASFCKQVRLNKEVIEPLYFLYWMKYLYDIRMIDRFQSQSTGIINFKFEYFLKKGDVMLPPMELMKKFADTIKPMRNEIMTLAKEIDNLTKQRDLLLPRLMSGKLEV